MPDQLHIVCLDAPAPPDYGGAIDMYCKIETLARMGIGVHLHYFSYRPGRDAGALAPLCASVHKYYRKSWPEAFPLLQPFITASRINDDLVDRLNGDDHPVLLEGIHCAGLLDSLDEHRKVIVRVHNDESVYYERLGRSEKKGWKRWYFNREASLLHTFQASLPKETVLACLSEKDRALFEKEYGFGHTSFVPSFIPWQAVTGPEGLGSYCLYHGNLSVAENEEAAAWLVREVFNDLQYPLVIAGKGVSATFKKLVGDKEQIRIIPDPPANELELLIRDAQLHVLPSLNETGVKLKLLHALFSGRHCIGNQNGIQGSGLETLVHPAESPAAWKTIIREKMAEPFSEAQRSARAAILSVVYDNRKNAEKLIALW